MCVSWYVCYRHRKRTWRPVFKSWTKLFVFQIRLILLGKGYIQQFFFQKWVNSRADWLLNRSWRRKTLNLNPLNSLKNVDLESLPPYAEELVHTHIHTYMCMCTYIHVRVHTYAHMRAHKHTHIHTYACTHLYIIFSFFERNRIITKFLDVNMIISILNNCKKKKQPQRILTYR